MRALTERLAAMMAALVGGTVLTALTALTASTSLTSLTGAVAVASPVGTPGRAHAAAGTVDTATQPYGGCAEAWQAPRSPGAERCRALGYTVSARFLVNPRGVVLHSSLPHCTHEDGSGGPRPCTWNIGRAIDGNGVGLAYKVRRDMSVRYVWAQRPTGDGWRWVGERQARRLVRHVTRPAQRRSVTAWQRCVTRRGGTTWVRCADGSRYRP